MKFLIIVNKLYKLSCFKINFFKIKKEITIIYRKSKAYLRALTKYTKFFSFQNKSLAYLWDNEFC